MLILSEAILQELNKRDLQNLKRAAKFLGISTELLRITVRQGHIPKDKILIKIAKKLDLDEGILLLSAHLQKVPADVKGYFLSPLEPKTWRTKRKHPLSEEQCNYLAKVMTAQEIQTVRMFRQISAKAKTQVIGYVDFVFVTKKK